MNTKQYIEAIIANNPSAVRDNLIAQGLIVEDYGYYDIDTLLDTIVQHLSLYDEEQGILFLSSVLDVPTLPSGTHGAYLQQLYANQQVQPSAQTLQVNHRPDWFFLLIEIAMIVLIIYLIRKI